MASSFRFWDRVEFTKISHEVRRPGSVTSESRGRPRIARISRPEINFPRNPCALWPVLARFDTPRNRVLSCPVPGLWREHTVVPNPLDILLWFIVFLFALSVHESAHALVSDRFGDDLGRSLGR